MSCSLTRRIILLFAIAQSALYVNGQSKAGVEQYNYIGAKDQDAVVPVVHFQTGKKWYTEMRYNYDELKTFSFYFGKSFSKENNFSWTATPMLGVCAGKLRGVSSALNIDLEWNNFYLWAQSQYTAALDHVNENFFYNWSELGYDISDHVFAGTALQYTKLPAEHILEPGLFAGLSVKNFSFPVYIFNPFEKGRYFVLALNYECDLKKKNKTNIH